MNHCDYFIDGNCCLSVMGNVEKCYQNGSKENCQLRKKFNEKFSIRIALEEKVR